jgi:hypothetical protein
VRLVILAITLAAMLSIAAGAVAVGAGVVLTERALMGGEC